jgi:large exoprotein involved in heme utilization and adhesion
MALTPGLPFAACWVFLFTGFLRFTGGLGVSCASVPVLASGAGGWLGIVTAEGGSSTGAGTGIGGGVASMGGATG